jgi:manganese/zinc/iron transport system permease protein
MTRIDFLRYDFAPLALAVMVSLACAIIGVFLVVRRQAMLGDAISHAVLPGIIIAFLVTGTRESLPMLFGALSAALLAAGIIAFLEQKLRLDRGAAMGIVFTSFFAAGVVLISQSRAANVHLDIEHALFGNLQNALWLEASGWSSLLDARALVALPDAVLPMLVMLVVVCVLVRLLFKELVIASFDPLQAQLAGFSPRLLGTLLLLLTAGVIVFAFEAVGVILVLAMLVCPPAAARLLTQDFPRQIGLAALISAVCAISGYILAGFGPLWLGWPHSLSASGMIGTMGGLALAASVALRKT